MSKIKNLFALTTALFLLSACGGGGGSSDPVSSGNTSPSVSEENVPSSILSTKVTLKGRVKDKTAGKALGHVKVSIDEATTTTDAEGYYELSDLNESDREVVTFESDGYVDNSAIVAIDDTTSLNYLEVSMDSYDSEEEHIINQDDIVIDATNGATVTIPTSTTYIEDSGQIFDGIVTFQAAYINVTTETGQAVFPGEYEGEDSSGSTVLFVSYGAISLELKDDSGNSLDLSGTATVTFPSLSLAEQDLIPLWYYDYAHGLWIEEGYAELQEDGTYQGEISHSGTLEPKQADRK